ncbi:MAG: hypothetical protein OEZ06_12440 [Myxococcales bacterium]|nr:hypothetical protein [Myxococcales bacterium]
MSRADNDNDGSAGSRPPASDTVGRYDRIPDVRDGLTRIERVILWTLDRAQKERGGRYVPTAMLYGRVVEHVNISVDEFQKTLARLTGRGGL